VAERLASQPLIVDVTGNGAKPGCPAATLHMLIGEARRRPGA